MGKSDCAKIRQFVVSEAFDIELAADRIFNRKESCKRFFADVAKKYKDKIGCYVFALRTGRGSLPYYVGKTVKSFEAEVFTLHKVQDHYQQIVRDYKGTPTLTFIVPEGRRGRNPEVAIKELEQHLIRAAFRRNQKLSNKQGLPKARWAIKGVIAARKGAPTAEEKIFKELMGY